MDIMVCGAGSMGTGIATVLNSCTEYHLHLADNHFHQMSIDKLNDRITTVALDVLDANAFTQYIHNKNIKAVISCLPAEHNPAIAQRVRDAGIHYFDLGEHLSIRQKIYKIAEGADSAFVPNCGLAPGFVGIVAYDLIQSFEQCSDIEIAVGTLLDISKSTCDFSPGQSVNRMINQYTITGNVIVNGQIESREPLTEICSVEYKDDIYETFLCSGGLGGLLDVCLGKVDNLNFRSMHRKGHCNNMRFLLHDLLLKEDRELLEQVLNKAIVSETSDKVVLSIRAKGQIAGYTEEKSYQRTLQPTTIEGIHMSAAQASSVIGASVVIDMVLQQVEEYRGLVFQERIGLQTFLANRFASYYV